MTSSLTEYNEVELVFGLFDINKDGYITQEEIRSAFMNYCSIVPSQKELNSMLKLSDDDHDGKISFQDFSVFYQKCMGLTSTSASTVAGSQQKSQRSPSLKSKANPEARKSTVASTAKTAPKKSDVQPDLSKGSVTSMSQQENNNLSTKEPLSSLTNASSISTPKSNSTSSSSTADNENLSVNSQSNSASTMETKISQNQVLSKEKEASVVSSVVKEAVIQEQSIKSAHEERNVESTRDAIPAYDGTVKSSELSKENPVDISTIDKAEDHELGHQNEEQPEPLDQEEEEIVIIDYIQVSLRPSSESDRDNHKQKQSAISNNERPIYIFLEPHLEIVDYVKVDLFQKGNSDKVEVCLTPMKKEVQFPPDYPRTVRIMVPPNIIGTDPGLCIPIYAEGENEIPPIQVTMTPIKVKATASGVRILEEDEEEEDNNDEEYLDDAAEEDLPSLQWKKFTPEEDKDLLEQKMNNMDDVLAELREGNFVLNKVEIKERPKRFVQTEREKVMQQIRDGIKLRPTVMVEKKFEITSEFALHIMDSSNDNLLEKEEVPEDW